MTNPLVHNDQTHWNHIQSPLLRYIWLYCLGLGIRTHIFEVITPKKEGGHGTLSALYGQLPTETVSKKYLSQHDWKKKKKKNISKKSNTKRPEFVGWYPMWSILYQLQFSYTSQTWSTDETGRRSPIPQWRRQSSLGRVISPNWRRLQKKWP